MAEALGSSPLIEEALSSAGTPLTVHHELQLLREQLEQQQQQTQAAVAQVSFLTKWNFFYKLFSSFFINKGDFLKMWVTQHTQRRIYSHNTFILQMNQFPD